MEAPWSRAPADVLWRDLVPQRRREIAWGVLCAVPWLLASWALAEGGWWLLGLPFSFMAFLACLGTAHDAEHGNLGLGRTATDLVMLAVSAVMLGSIHAVQVTHLRHHRFACGPGDTEAAPARMSVVRAIFDGPRFAASFLVQGLRHGDPRHRRWIALELAVSGLVIAAALAPGAPAWLRYHVPVVLLGNCLTGFFCVWSVHHGARPGDEPVTRTLPPGIVARLAHGLLFHAEHHLFPKVPGCHLGALARRLEAQRPDLRRHGVFGQRDAGASTRGTGRKSTTSCLLGGMRSTPGITS